VVTDQLDRGVVRSEAPNGLVVVTESMPAFRSAAVGIWVRSASAHDAREQMGAAHLLEHLVFKGTERRPAADLARALETRGGSLDAYTSRDHTGYQAHVLDEDVPLAIDILTDLVRRPLLRSEDLDLERNVVLEEIRAVDDTPEDLVFELQSAALWPDHPYGYSILGTQETVGSISADALRSVHRGGYYPGNCVVAAAGNLSHEQVIDRLGAEGWFDDAGRVAPREPVRAGEGSRGSRRRVERETAQTHIVWGTDTFPSRDPRRFGLAMLVNELGGGMASRLFQRVREELGLAYSVYAYQHLLRAAGVIGVYLGTSRDNVEAATAAVEAELRRLAVEGLSGDDLTANKRQLRGQLMLGLEHAASRMLRLAAFVLNDDRYRPLDELLAVVDRVTAAEVAATAAEFFSPERFTRVSLGA